MCGGGGGDGGGGQKSLAPLASKCFFLSTLSLFFHAVPRRSLRGRLNISGNVCQRRPGGERAQGRSTGGASERASDPRRGRRFLLNGLPVGCPSRDTSWSPGGAHPRSGARGGRIVRLTPNILLSSGDQDDVMMSLMLLAVAAGRRDLGKGSMF